MPAVKIDLQEGFDKDTVVIRVNEREVFRKDRVTTRVQTGYADSVQVMVDPGTAVVQVDLLDKGLSENITVPTSPKTTYVAISITKGKIVHQVSNQMFGYV